MKVTPEEEAAVRAFAEHGGVKGAAAALGKSPHTIEQQLKSARRRVGVGSTVEVIDRLYLKNGDTVIRL